MDIEIRLLRHAITLAHEGSFAKASRLLHLSQPALTRSIQQIERRVGTRLFERGRGGATPTDAGRIFLRHATEVLAVAGDMERGMALLQGLHLGDLRVGAGTFPSELFMAEALARLALPESSARIKLVQDEAPGIIARLRRREIDVGIADPNWLEQTTDIRAEPLSTYKGVLVVRAGHPLLNIRDIQLEQVITYPLISTASSATRLAQMARQAKPANRKLMSRLEHWGPTITVESVTMMKRIVAMSDGVTLLSRSLIKDEVKRGVLAILPVAVPWMSVSFAVLHLAHRTLSPLGEAFIAAIRKADAALHAEEVRLSRK